MARESSASASEQWGADELPLIFALIVGSGKWCGAD